MLGGGDNINELLNIGRGSHERQGDEINVLGERERRILAVLCRQRRGGNIHPRQVDALVIADRPAGDNATPDIRSVDAQHLEFDGAVVQQDAVARRHVARERLVLRRNDARVAEHIPRGNRDFGTGLQFDRPAGKLAGADFRATQIREDGRVHFERCRAFAYRRDSRAVRRMRAVRHIDPEHADPGVDQGVNCRRIRARGSDRGDDFRPPVFQEIKLGYDGHGTQPGEEETALQSIARLSASALPNTCTCHTSRRAEPESR